MPRNSKKGTDEALIEVLRHPFRRALLKRFIESGEELSPSDLAEGRGQKALSNLSYHIRTLAEFGALDLTRTEPSKGSMKHFYVASKKARETPWLIAALGLPPGPH